MQSSGLDWTLWLAMLASFFALPCCSSSHSLVWVLHLVTVTPFNNSNWFENYKNDNYFCCNFFQQTISTKLNKKHIAFPLKKKVSHVLTVNLYVMLSLPLTIFNFFKKQRQTCSSYKCKNVNIVINLGKVQKSMCSLIHQFNVYLNGNLSD